MLVIETHAFTYHIPHQYRFQTNVGMTRARLFKGFLCIISGNRAQHSSIRAIDGSQMLPLNAHWIEKAQC